MKYALKINLCVDGDNPSHAIELFLKMCGTGRKFLETGAAIAAVQADPNYIPVTVVVSPTHLLDLVGGVLASAGLLISGHDNTKGQVYGSVSPHQFDGLSSIPGVMEVCQRSIIR